LGLYAIHHYLPDQFHLQKNHFQLFIVVPDNANKVCPLQLILMISITKAALETLIFTEPLNKNSILFSFFPDVYLRKQSSDSGKIKHMHVINPAYFIISTYHAKQRQIN